MCVDRVIALFGLSIPLRVGLLIGNTKSYGGFERDVVIEVSAVIFDKLQLYLLKFLTFDHQEAGA